MTWVKLDDRFFTRAKAQRAGKDGRSLYLAGLCFCAANLTDGIITPHDLRFVAQQAEVRPATSRKLVEVGLWDEHPQGFAVHDYLEYNPTAESVRARREDDRVRKEKGRDSRRNPHGIQAESAKNPPVPLPHPSPTNKSSPTNESVGHPVVGEVLSRIADREVTAARQAGTLPRSEAGFRKHKLAEAQARYGDTAQRITSEDPSVTARELDGILTNPAIANGYYARRAG